MPERLIMIEHQSPIISIIVPTYNRAHLLRRLLNSLVQQTDPRFELIVVDDGSTDPTRELIEEFRPPLNRRLIFVRHPTNLGCNAARNTGVRASRTPWCLFVDSDWELFPESVQSAIQHSHVEVDVGAVIFLSLLFPGNLVRGYRSDDQAWETAVPSYEDAVLGRNVTGGMFCMIRRSVFSEDGLWFPDWVNGMESLLAARLARRRRIVAIRHVLGITHFDPSEDRITTRGHQKWPREFGRGHELFIAENYDVLKHHPKNYRRRVLQVMHCALYSGAYGRALVWGVRAAYWKLRLILRPSGRNRSWQREGSLFVSDRVVPVIDSDHLHYSG